MGLKDKVVFITGASRGIGKAIAMRCARDGAKIAVIGKTSEPHPKLPGIVYTAVDDIKDAGGDAIPCIADIRFEDQVQAAVDATIEKFGKIDILVNNASAISLTPTLGTSIKRFDLMFDINVRGTFLCSKLCIPFLKQSDNPHILVLSPPLVMEPTWFASSLAYTMSKFGMSMCVLGLAEEFKRFGIGVNALWPKTTIATSAVKNLLGGETAMKHSRKPDIVADAAYVIFNKSSRECSGNFFIDEDVLKEAGITDFQKYSFVPNAELTPDLFFKNAKSDLNGL